MPDAKFKDEDIIEFDRKLSQLKDIYPTSYASRILTDVVIKNSTDIDIRQIVEFLGRFISFTASNYLTYLNFKLIVNWMEPNQDSYWLKDASYSGLYDYDKNEITINLRKDFKHSNLSLAWILLHEFRHLLQGRIQNIESNVNNNNWKLLVEYLKSKGNDENTINHVLHEIAPYEVDANTFACESLGIDYPGSKFEVNEYTIGLLK